MLTPSTNAGPGIDGEARLTSNTATARRVLGDVSPNVRNAPEHGLLGGKPSTSNPLKRGLTTAMDSGHGFQYLKRRKLSTESPLCQVENQSDLGSNGCAVSTQGLRDSSSRNQHHLDLPTIQQLSPTEPNTPTGSFPADDNEDSSAERKSFSSLINYDQSSQAAPRSQQRKGRVFNGPSYAELLRLRLRVAMYKVETDQVRTPFADLQVQPSDESCPPTADQSRSDIWPQAQQAVPQLLPAPVLRPTHYSTRKIYGSPTRSPPLVTRSPAASLHGPQISTPPSSRSARVEEQELTSSIVKGRVAEGLLGLRNAV